jgi:hypothetical protein
MLVVFSFIVIGKGGFKAEAKHEGLFFLIHTAPLD